MTRRLLTLAMALYSLPVHALELENPVSCNIGADCFIQNYVDTDPSPVAYRDHRCGALSYDGHDGTDFRLSSVNEIASNVSVLAAAAGTVRAVRDGMADINVKSSGKAGVKDKECGNGVLVEHGGGWETQYCHLANGSVAVREGQTVKAGGKLGFIGMSGMAEFPHLHLSVRHNGKELDPFTGRETGSVCGQEAKPDQLWSASSGLRNFYQPTALLSAGFRAGAPDTRGGLDGLDAQKSLPSDTSALVIWVNIMGVQAGDMLEVKLVPPAGETRIFSNIFKERKAQMFYYTGIKNKGGGFPAGFYEGRISLKRNGETVFQRAISAAVE